MKKAIFILFVVAALAVSAHAQPPAAKRQGQPGMGPGSEMGKMGMMGKPMSMPMKHQCGPMMGHQAMRDTMHVVLDLVKIEERMVDAGPAEKKRLKQDLAELRERMLKIMYTPMGMPMGGAPGDTGPAEDPGEIPAEMAPQK